MGRAPKKKARSKKRKQAQGVKRSQKADKAAELPPPGYLPEGAPAFRKAVCVNMECKLRRTGCYGYEGCPGYKSHE